MNSPHKWPVTRKIFPFDDVIKCNLVPDWQFAASIVTYLTSKGHDDVIKWKYFPRFWPFVGNSPVTAKTNFMLLTPKHLSRYVSDIYVNGTCIIGVTETKFLGIIIDYKLNCSSHIMNISKGIAKGVGTILKSKRYSTMKHWRPCTIHVFTPI